MPNLSKYPDFNNQFDQDQQGVANFLRDVKINLEAGAFIPTYTGITGASSVTGRYQRIGSIIFVHYRVNSGGSFSIAAGDCLKLPIKPLQANGVNFLPQNSFTYAPYNSQALQHWYMDNTSQYIKCTTAVGTTTSPGFTVSGWYMVE